MKHPNQNDDTLYFIDSFMTQVGSFLTSFCERDTLDTQMLGTEYKGCIEMTEFDLERDMSPPAVQSHLSDEASQVFETTDSERPLETPSLETPPTLELKELPSHLEYAYLGEDSQLPVIISSELTKDEKERLLCVLKAHKRAIAWKLFDIKGIHPSFCTHKILMTEEFKPVVQPQRRLNPNMQDVVKKEVIKLLDAGLIYPISDSSWVSPVQVVPKRGV